MNPEELLSGLLATEGFNERLRPLGLQFEVSTGDANTPENEALEVAGKVVGQMKVARSESPLSDEALDNLIDMVREQLQSELLLRYELQNTLEERRRKWARMDVKFLELSKRPWSHSRHPHDLALLLEQAVGG